MPDLTKIATCSYCGTRSILRLTGKVQHELACSACGAKLHTMKPLRVDRGRDRPETRAPQRRRKPAWQAPTQPKRKPKRRRSGFQRAAATARSICAGLAWSTTGWAIPAPVGEFLSILGAAATPGALFAIGASLAFKSAERLSVAGWLSFAKLVLHPAGVAIAALLVFPVDRFAAGVMISAAALPVAGNVYILAQHYGVAPTRVSASILVSTIASVVTVSLVIAWVAV